MFHPLVIKKKLPLLFILALGLHAQTPRSTSTDVHGWDQIKWGMTLDQAATLYNVSKTNKEQGIDDWMLLKLPPITIAGTSMNVAVAARLNKISQVTIDLHDPVKQMMASLHRELARAKGQDIAPEDAEDTDAPPMFEKLKVLLMQKYGHPAEDKAQSLLWVFPSSSISLELDVSDRLSNVLVIYKAKEKSGLVNCSWLCLGIRPLTFAGSNW